jgi:hypothetical protein
MLFMKSQIHQNSWNLLMLVKIMVLLSLKYEIRRNVGGRIHWKWPPTLITTRQEAWRWRSRWNHGDGDHYDSKGHTIHKYNLIICMWCLFSYHTILSCYTCGGCIFMIE